MDLNYCNILNVFRPRSVHRVREWDTCSKKSSLPPLSVARVNETSDTRHVQSRPATSCGPQHIIWDVSMIFRRPQRACTMETQRVCLSTVSFFIGWVDYPFVQGGHWLAPSLIIRYAMPLLYAGCLSTFSATPLKKRIWTALRMCKFWLLTGQQIVFEPLPLYKFCLRMPVNVIQVLRISFWNK